MFYFFVEVIGVSILVSLFANWIKLVPRYPKWKYALLQQLINTGILTILLTIFFAFRVYPSWGILFILIVVILWWSVRLTNNIVPKEGKLPEEETSEDHHI